jgi:amidophosphoribosyltransferase
LPLDSITRCLDLPAEALCQACITREYPTEAGLELYQIAKSNAETGQDGRTYEGLPLVGVVRG